MYITVQNCNSNRLIFCIKDILRLFANFFFIKIQNFIHFAWVSSASLPWNTHSNNRTADNNSRHKSIKFTTYWFCLSVCLCLKSILCRSYFCISWLLWLCAQCMCIYLLYINSNKLPHSLNLSRLAFYT